MYSLCIANADKVSGKIFNVGGGPDKALSILESLEMLEQAMEMKIPLDFSDWRPGDQPIFISCNELAHSVVGWQPQVSVQEGLGRLVQWIRPNLDKIRGLLGQ